MMDAETLDTIHAGILLLGLWVVIDVIARYTLPILTGAAIAAVWTFGYWGFVKLVLPVKWSGQT